MVNLPKPDSPSLRLNRFLADAGLGSRRGVENLVRQGRVVVNGKATSELGLRIDPDRDEVRVDGQVVTAAASGLVYAFHKPLGVVCTFRGQGGQPTLAPYKRQANLPGPMMPIGRLDADSTGLLLWTDDGNLNHALCRPESGIWKTYVVTLDRQPSAAEVRRFTGGRISLDGWPCLPCGLEPAPGGREAWKVRIHEGRKRQIRRMFRAIGNRVVTLHRVEFGPISLGGLAGESFRALDKAEIAALRQAVAAPGGK
ncbi:rRNA pseudouridine synthase [bacterium]|nr:rRNA pseudouridine synthase [bacterium]